MRIIKTSIDLKYQESSLDCIFLGTWCYKKNKNIINDIKNKKIIPYHWDDKSKFKNDHIFLKDIYERKLKDCSISLNKIHKIDRDIKYWRVIIGPWLNFFIDALYDRYECINQASTLNKEYTYLIHNYDEDISTRDFSDFYNKLTSDDWNEIIFSECIKSQNIPYISTNNKIENENKLKDKGNAIRNIIIIFIRAYQSIISIFKRRVSIISPYINFYMSIKLQILLKNIPYLLAPEVNSKVKGIDDEVRRMFQFTETTDGFESFINKQIIKNIPKVYVESYDVFKRKALRLFPRETQVIYTSTAYQSNDAFKFWAAEKCYFGSKLIIGQHGGTFGLSYLNQTEDHQMNIADKFISWGWKSKANKHVVPMPSIRLNGNSSMYSSQKDKGPFIHVLGGLPRYFYNFFSMPIAGQFSNYLEDQIIFLSELNKNNLKKVKIRQDITSIKWGWDIEGVLKKNGFSDNIFNTNISLINQLKGASLCICTHNGSVPLESLALNFPTIIFWDSNYYEIRAESIEDMRMLKDVGIFYDCPKLAAGHINKISDDISSWWKQESIQNARYSFVNKYALNSDNSLNLLKEFLTKEANV